MGGVRIATIVGSFFALVVIVALATLWARRPEPGPQPPGESSASSLAKPAPGEQGDTPAAEPGSAQATKAVPGTTAEAASPTNSLAALIKTLNDTSLSLADRKEAIMALAQLGSPEALKALRSALASGDKDLRSAIAEGLGACSTTECTALMASLLNDPAQDVVKAALRGLGLQGTPESAAALTQFLMDDQRDGLLRCDAALALGTINQPGVMNTLTQATMTIRNEEIVKQVLNAIGGRDIAETRSFYENYLRSSTVSPELKTAAVESLSEAKGDASQFLSTLLADLDPEIRESAGWAMSATDAPGTMGAQLISALMSESDPDVRRRLYQALRNQESWDINTALSLVQRENDLTARVAGLNLLAASMQTGTTPEAQAYFNQTAAPELANIAVSGENATDRSAALIALIRANTPSAANAIQTIASQATDPKVQQSAQRYLATLAKLNK